MALALDNEHRAFQQEILSFFATEYPQDLLEKVRRGDRLTKEDHLRSQRAIQTQGWLGMGWPEAHGGPCWTELKRYLFEEALELAGAPSLIPMGLMYVAPVISEFATEEQQQRWLPDLLHSRSFWCQGYSEVESGSDLASLSMKAEREGDDYILNGHKIWTTLAQWADWIFCLVRTSRGEHKHEGISFVCVEMNSPGVTVEPIVLMNGAWELNRVVFENVRVPVANRIGEEGDGWKLANFLLANERLSYAHIGKKKKDLRNLRAAAQARGMLDDVFFQSRLAALEIRLSILETTVQRALFDNIAPSTVAALKILITECAQGIDELALALFGEQALAYPDRDRADWAAPLRVTDSQAPAWMDAYLYDRAQTIYGGTTEVQKNIIWKSLAR